MNSIVDSIITEIQLGELDSNGGGGFPPNRSSIKDMVGGDRKVSFTFYRDKNLWYVTECGFEFPVPIEDIGNATFLNEDRAMLFMRWIRKHIQLVEAGQASKNNG